MIPDYISDATPDTINASITRSKDILNTLLRIRPQDKLLILADSLADMRVFHIFSQECINQHVDTRLIYFQTNVYDLSPNNNPNISYIRKLGIPVSIFDGLQINPDILHLVVQTIASTQFTVAVANLSDDYDIRQAINDYASKQLIPILELPTIDMLSFSSPIFSEDMAKMRVLGNKIIKQLLKYDSFHLKSSDGTDLSLTVNPHWLNEAENDFTSRHWDYSGNSQLPPPPQDNPPGEVYTNIRNANGKLVLYQFDNDVAKYALRNKNYYPSRIKEEDYLKYVFDISDPVSLEITEGFINLESITASRSIRSQILKNYLEEKQEEDRIYITEFVKHPQAALRAVEFALGTNSKANNPDEEVLPGLYIDSALITEKKLGIWHIAFGNTPCFDTEKYFNHSSTHIDCGLRNPDLQVFGVKGHGDNLLTSALSGVPGSLDKIINTNT